MKKEINVLVKEPGCDLFERRKIPNTLEALQEIVGGYIELVQPCVDLALIVNEEGKIKGMPYNFTFLNEDLVGPVIAVGVDGEDFDDVPADINTERWFGIKEA